MDDPVHPNKTTPNRHFWKCNPSASSYREEMLGLHAMHILVWAISKHHHLHHWSAILCCYKKRPWRYLITTFNVEGENQVPSVQISSKASAQSRWTPLVTLPICMSTDTWTSTSCGKGWHWSSKWIVHATHLQKLLSHLSRTQKSSNQNLLYREMSNRSGSNLVLHVPINFYSYTCNNV